MLKCPKCEAEMGVNLPSDSPMKDMADLSRQKRKAGGVGVIKCAGCGYEGDPLEFDPRSTLPKVVKCYITTKGMVIAFDAEDNQVCPCQGFILVVASELKIRCDEKTQFYYGKAGAWLKEVDFRWWFLDG